jgi:predicted  nucleic acid-binding Zn-ribbon protein
VQDEVDRYNTEISLFTNQLDTYKQAAYDLRKEVDGHELYMKEADHQEALAKKRLENVANQKEYQSIRKEIENLKKQQFGFEEIILDTWNKLEVAQRAYEEKKKEFSGKIEELQKLIQEKERRIEQMHAEVVERHKIRQGQEVGIPAEWLERYSMMRLKVNNPVVQVINGLCSACFFQVSPQDMILLRRHKLIQCKDCYRFLYLEASAPTV